MSLMDCLKCAHPLPMDERFLTCTDCENGYHLGKSCSGVSESTFLAMGASRKESWRCLTCRTGELRSGCAAGSGVPARAADQAGKVQQEQATTVSDQLTSISTTLNQLLSLKTSVETLLPLPAKVDQLLTLKPVVEELRSTVSVLQTTVDTFSTNYDSVLALAMTNQESVKDLQQEICTVRASMEDQSREISRLKEELNDTQQYSRRCNMEIHGLTFVPGEDLIATLTDLAQNLGLPSFQSSDILTMHRLPTKRDTAPIVLIRFASVGIKETWMAARGKLRKPRQGGDQSLFFNDNLTQANKELFWLARTKGKEHGYRFVWLKNTKIYARKDEGTPVIRIAAVRDLEKLV